MVVRALGPLDWRIPIVTKDGQPTYEFQRRWADQINNNSQIGSITLGLGPPPADPAPVDGAQYADTSTNPYTIYVGNGGIWNLAGAAGANPTAVAKDTPTNGTADTFMRSDASPAVQKGLSTQFGIVKVDGTTIISTAGVISATGGGGGGSLTLISEITTSSLQADVTFSSIPNTYRDLEVRVRGASAVVAGFDSLSMQYNGDTGANYDFVLSAYNSSGGTFFSGSIGATAIEIGFMPGTTAPSNSASLCIVNIGDYRGILFCKNGESRSGYRLDSGSGSAGQRINSHQWNSTAAITDIRVFPGTGPFADGTIVSLYGQM